MFQTTNQLIVFNLFRVEDFSYNWDDARYDPPVAFPGV